MTRHIAARFALIALTTVLPVASHAASFKLVSGDKIVKQKMVKLTVRNGASEPRSFKVGDKVITLKANETLAVEAPVNSAITSVGDTPSHKDGDVMLTITSNMNGVLCTFS